MSVLTRLEGVLILGGGHESRVSYWEDVCKQVRSLSS